MTSMCSWKLISVVGRYCQGGEDHLGSQGGSADEHAGYRAQVLLPPEHRTGSLGDGAPNDEFFLRRAATPTEGLQGTPEPRSDCLDTGLCVVPCKVLLI